MDIYKLKFTILQSEIFSLLAIKAGEKLSQREIAQSLSVSPTAVAKSIAGLKEAGLVGVDVTRTSNLISFNRANQRAIELKRVENLRNIYVSGLSDHLDRELAGGTIIIFGSYARGEDLNLSDIDLAVIGRKDKLLHLESYETILNRKINVNFFKSFKVIDIHLRDSILGGILLQGGINL